MQNKEIEKRFFYKFRQTGYDVFKTVTYKKFLSLFVKLIHPVIGQKCLEIGCGTGSFTKYLSLIKLNIIAVDISTECIEYAVKQNIKNVTFVVGDAENLNFEDNTFDIVVSMACLHHFAYDLSRVLKEIYRVLKPSGKLFACEPNIKNPIMYLYRCPSSPFYSPLGVTKNEAPLSKNYLLMSLRSIGFSKIDIFGISGVEYRYIESDIAKKFLWLYNFFEKIFGFTFLAKDYGSFLVVTAEK